ncbi:MAG: hypothetical protein H7138_13460 [Myxococcales bacterium]|nr:hypothetical protein [Myxococcales bacterium]
MFVTGGTHAGHAAGGSGNGRDDGDGADGDDGGVAPTERSVEDRRRDAAREPLAAEVVDAYANHGGLFTSRVARWSPDGKQISFGSARDGVPEIRTAFVSEFGDVENDAQLLEQFSPMRDVDRIVRPLSCTRARMTRACRAASPIRS